ncbi:hypothetical protein [Cellulomonas sp. PhB150]|uniref:hypothetical protein n=1 Tax=Cellulomonas sp. PhB150 TaxID=2485188 RepID=UPI000F9AB8DA|nr:hypothetical protein [Cellulomonas sp. PhB150]ROS26051.1 hypothetical protein EDF34_2380 [Cellulomonas sp. PhB150]
MTLVRRVAGPAAAAVAVASLASCSLGGATGTEATQPLGDAVDAASSAVATSQLATDLLVRHRATATVVDTALLDQIHVLDSSTFALMTALPGDPAAIDLRGDAIQAVADAAAAVADARAWTNSARTSPARTAGVVGSLDDSADALDEVSAAIEGS